MSVPADRHSSPIQPVTAEPSDQRWIAAIRAGDERVFDELFSATYASLCDFVHSYVRSHATAEELVQTVFLRLWEKRTGWEPRTSVRAYLFAACRNQALDHLRHVRIMDRAVEQGGGEGATFGQGAGVPRTDQAVQDAELAGAIQRAIDSLPDRRRLVAIMRWQHQLSNVEIARVLGISVKGVEAHVARAIGVLRDKLSGFRP